MRRRDDGSTPRQLTASSPLDEWRAEFAAADAFDRIQVRVRLVRVRERDPVRRAVLKDLLEEMRMCR